jgi:peptide/nickel transport system permease protein
MVVVDETRVRRLLRSSPVSSPWPRFLLRRLVALIVIAFVLSFLTFVMVRLIPGDPAVAIAGLSATPAQIAKIHAQLGLNQPLLSQFGSYLSGILHGQMGTSFVTDEPVSSILRQRAPISAELTGLALAAILVIGVPLGIAVAAHTKNNRHPRSEVAFTAIASIGGSIPQFVMATLLAAVFGVALRVLPVASLNGWRSYILPVAAIAAQPLFVLARIVRVETLNVLAQDYVRTAESKRLKRSTIYIRHVLPNTFTAALTVGGILFATLIAGSVFVENIFTLPGLGSELVSSVQNHDYPVVQGIVLVLGVIVVVVNMIVDIVLGIVDPRSLVSDS